VTSACDQKVSVVGPPGKDSTGTGGGGGGGGTVQRAALTLQIVVPNADDAAVATSLGSPGGVLRGVEVTIERDGSAASRVSAISDSAGTVRFTGLLPGTYQVSFTRAISTTELSQLGPRNADLIGFGGGANLTVAAPNTTSQLEAVLGRRGSLVISEFYQYTPRAADGGYYFNASYVELYNNSDTTIYLDGKIIGTAVNAIYEILPDHPCDVTARYRTDPDGIWSRDFWRFPGTGRDYPLAAGRVTVAAADAINHAEFVPGLPDLRQANFEFRGGSDVDNPAVPELVNLGAGTGTPANAGGLGGHGFHPNSNGLTFFVVDVVDVGTLPAANIFPEFFQNRSEHRRFPRDKVLDVFSSLIVPEQLATLTRRACPENVHTNFDRTRANLTDIDLPGSLQRRVFRAEQGRPVLLQRTLTSARDFERVSRETPGTVP